MKPLMLLLGCCACAGGFAAAGPTADVGTLAVSGLGTGIGGHVELGMTWERKHSILGAALTGTVAGYASAGDADPVLFTALEIRSRRWLGSPARSPRPFFEIGGGPIMAWVAGPMAGGLGAHIGAGIQAVRPTWQWWVALRARPAGLVGGRQAEFFNSTQLVFGLTRARRGAP
jgi:hypothetical protein